MSFGLSAYLHLALKMLSFAVSGVSVRGARSRWCGFLVGAFLHILSLSLTTPLLLYEIDLLSQRYHGPVSILIL